MFGTHTDNGVQLCQHQQILGSCIQDHHMSCRCRSQLVFYSCCGRPSGEASWASQIQAADRILHETGHSFYLYGRESNYRLPSGAEIHVLGIEPSVAYKRMGWFRRLQRAQQFGEVTIESKTIHQLSVILPSIPVVFFCDIPMQSI